MDDAQFALIVEAMHQVAADPDCWGQLIEALAEAPPRDDPPAHAMSALNQSREIARLVSDQDRAARQGPAHGVGWAVLSARRKVIAANDQAHAIMAQGLGELPVGGALAFLDPANDDALDQAIAQSRTRSQAILKLERDDETGPCFAIVTPARAFPGMADSGGSALAATDQAFAIVFPAVEETGRLWTSIRESFGLTAAEIRLAARLRDGKTLKEAADELNVSINTVRNQLRAIFDKMGLKRQSELVRALAELSHLAGAIEAAEPAPPPPAVAAPPVQRMRLTDGRRLAYREYGAPQGRPLLLFHEGLGSSLLPPPAQALAAELGLRVISTDRPGFGQSDPHPEYGFDTVADDMVDLCDRLGIETVRISAILSGAPFAIQTATRLGERAQGVLICSGRPPRPTVKGGDIVSIFRARLERNPWVVETFYAILRLRLTTSLTTRLARSTTANSPGDRAFLEANPWAIDYITAYVSECLAETSRGAADEVKAFRRGGNLTAADLKCRLTVWHGADDKFAPLSDFLDYLGGRADEVRIWPGIGHMLALKHWDELLRFAAA